MVSWLSTPYYKSYHHYQSSQRRVVFLIDLNLYHFKIQMILFLLFTFYFEFISSDSPTVADGIWICATSVHLNIISQSYTLYTIEQSVTTSVCGLMNYTTFQRQSIFLLIRQWLKVCGQMEFKNFVIYYIVEVVWLSMFRYQ